jgi:uncharacterized protein YbbK (DUF523 family)
MKPRVGVSSCLLGERVRYDGGDKRHDWLVEVAGPQVEWVRVCPEVEAGLGTPREPMDLERDEAGRIVLRTKHTRRDLTAQLGIYAIRRVAELEAEGLSGYVLKSGSPSCGLTPSRGLFAEALVRRFPGLPVEDELALSNPDRCAEFLNRVFAYHRQRHA